MDFAAWTLVSGFLVLSLIGCASTSAKLPLPPAKYVYNMDVPPHTGSTNSLWSDTSNIIEDTKARQVNDLVTIEIVESLSGSGKADTDTSRDSSADYDMTNFLGMNNDFNIQNVKFLKDLYKGTNVFQPKIVGSGKSDFKGEGDTNRAGTLNATITAKVVETLPNGNLLLEARKELTINEENQILVLTGVVRPYDIDADNTVLSDKLADARIYYVGDGVINDKQKPGWMVRVFDNIWPF
jgi:flagellar L-ring protein precursor FlgH